MESFLSQAGDSYFDWNYYFGAIGEIEGGLSCQGSCCSPVCPENIGQLFQPYALCLVQPSLDDLEQGPVCHFCLAISLGVTKG